MNSSNTPGTFGLLTGSSVREATRNRLSLSNRDDDRVCRLRRMVVLMKGRGGVPCPAHKVGTKMQEQWLPSAGKSRKGAGRARRAYHQVLRDLVAQSREYGFHNGHRLVKP